MTRQTEEFLLRHQMGNDPLDTVIPRFINQAKAGLSKNGESCFEMIPSYVQADGTIPPNEPVIVIDAGGTNLRVAFAHFNEDHECITEKLDVYPMPGAMGATITIEDFYTALARCLSPYAPLCHTIGFVFSFPCDITPDIDGRVIVFDKEVSILHAEGSLLGENINRALNDLGIEGSWKVIVMNDTISTVMGGLAGAKNPKSEHYLGVILGSGMNITYLQKCSGIQKDPAIQKRTGSMCINMEAGGFDGFIKSDFDRIVQEKAELPGHMQFEKMVSGVYQGMIAEEMLRCAAREGLFGERTAASLARLEHLQAYEMDAYVRDPSGGNRLASLVAPADKSTVYDLLDCYYDRTARLVAIALTCVMLLAGEEDTGSLSSGAGMKPYCNVADGSTFYKTLLFRPKLARYMEEIAGKQYGLQYRFLKVEDENISGGAVAALINR